MAVGESNVMRVVEGGDDVTVICDGSQAIEFTRVYLETFEHMTAAIMREVSERIRTSEIPSFLTACAGIAIIKPHFPFFISQDIAEALTASAKAHSRDSVQAISSLDFHLVSDSAQTELRSIRAGRRSDNQEVRLWGGPYTVGKSSSSNLRDVEWLQRAVEAARATDEEGRRILPRSTAMKIKQALFAGPDVAAQVARESVASVPSAILDSSSLVRKDEDDMSSAFIDILDLVDLGPGGSE
jgi:hypothetical protein